jgi:hypothetical protein
MFELLITEEAQWRIRDAHQRYPNYDQAGISADPIFQMGGSRGKGHVFVEDWDVPWPGSRRLCAEMSLVNGQVSENLANPSLLFSGWPKFKYCTVARVLVSQSTPIQRKGPPSPIVADK